LWEDNIKIDLKEMDCEGMDEFTCLIIGISGRLLWPQLISLWVPRNVEKFLGSWGRISLFSLELGGWLVGLLVCYLIG